MILGSFTFNPISLAIGVGIILFVMIYEIISVRLKQKGIAVIIAISISMIASNQIYQNKQTNLEGALGTIVIIGVLIIMYKLFKGLVSYQKYSYA